MTRVSEFNDDKVTDRVARDRAGQLCPYPGNGTGGFATRTPAGTGWRGIIPEAA